jgi:acrylyl-CoA reductase (NADPH)
MTPTQFKALVVERDGEEGFSRTVRTLELDDLPAGNLLVKVAYSSLNYKDALSATGRYGVTRHYPHVPGIDAAGTVMESASDEYRTGDEVLLGGFDFGVDAHGGFAGYARVPAGWAVRLPEGLTLLESAAYGAAGFTAAQAVMRLIDHGLRPEAGEVLVTGATGGVGSLAVAFLAKAGFQVAAGTGKPEAHDFLTGLGAAAIIPREELDDASGKGLLKGRWAGVVDTVGGNYLATALKSTRYGGAVAAIGNAASDEMKLTVYPFILRAVALYGIDSANVPPFRKGQVWEKMAGDWKPEGLEKLARVVTLEGLEAEIQRILRGGQVGRVVVDPWR